MVMSSVGSVTVASAPMEIRWLTAFIDMPADRFDAGTSFWRDITGSDISEPRGEHDQFATMIPPGGDAYLRVQRVGDDQARVHLDLHVDSIPEAKETAIGLGARLVTDLGWLIMASPAGLPFCFVADNGESTRTPPQFEPPRLLDQLSIDVPAEHFDSEGRFWARLTGWELSPGRLEFVRLSTPSQLPYRILLQCLGDDDPDSTARAHLDIACGDNIDSIAAEHERLGAKNLGRRHYWVTMQDPAGLPYCLTPRDPATGQAPA